MRGMIGGVVGFLGIAIGVPLICKLVKERKAKKEKEIESECEKWFGPNKGRKQTGEMNRIGQQLDELAKQMEKLEKSQKEQREQTYELMKQLILLMEEGNPDIIIM